MDEIYLGAVANDGTGDHNRTAFGKCNTNFAELDARVPPLLSLEALEALAAFNAVSLQESGGAVGVSKADASDNTLPCDGFVIADVVIGDPAAVIPLGALVSGFPALSFTPGTVYYLSTAAGGLTDDVSAYAAGNLVQEIGRAISATSLLTYRTPPTTLG